MEKEKKSKLKFTVESFNLREVIILVVITALVSLMTGYAITNRVLKDKYAVNESGEDNKYLQTFVDNYKYILNNYYGQLDEQKLLDAALEGLLNEIGDPHTAYIDENEVNNFNIKLQGSYDGFGVEIYNNDSGKLQILSVFSDSPADKSGLKSGDLIQKLNNQDVSEIKSVDFSNIIKNNAVSDFSLTIEREGKPITVNIKKETVTIKSVGSRIIDSDSKKIGYLGISIFANNTYAQVKENLESLEKTGIDSLIIDVRGNTGGHLTSVENILGLFLDNSHVIYQIQDGSGIQKFYSEGIETKNYPIVVLTNENSASASEILAAALKEEYGATIVGKKTYGKGSAQELRTLPDGTQYKITTRKWLTPSGKSIDGVGIEADIVSEFDSEKYYNNPIDANDSQLQAAIQKIKEG